MARRLRLARRDADARADERVQQRRLADRRPSDDRDVTAAMRSRSVTRRRVCSRAPRRAPAVAASCSAARRLARAAARRSTSAGNPAFDGEHAARALRRSSRRSRIRAPAAAAPAAIPAAASSDPCRASPDRRRAARRRSTASIVRARGVEAAVEEHGAEHRLHRVGQDRRRGRCRRSSLRLRRARTHAPSPRRRATLRQRVLVDEMRARRATVRLRECRETLVQSAARRRSSARRRR